MFNDKCFTPGWLESFRKQGAHKHIQTNILEKMIDAPEWNFLNKLKRQPDKSAFYYWCQTVQLLTKTKS